MVERSREKPGLHHSGSTKRGTSDGYQPVLGGSEHSGPVEYDVSSVDYRSISHRSVIWLHRSVIGRFRWIREHIADGPSFAFRTQ